MVRIPWKAIASAKGLGLRDSFDSMECVSASTPVAAVTAGGIPTVRAGSRIVQTGSTDGWPTYALRPAASSVITPNVWLSAPVPAVVGTAIRGRPGTRSSR